MRQLSWIEIGELSIENLSCCWNLTFPSKFEKWGGWKVHLQFCLLTYDAIAFWSTSFKDSSCSDFDKVCFFSRSHLSTDGGPRIWQRSIEGHKWWRLFPLLPGFRCGLLNNWNKWRLVPIFWSLPALLVVFLFVLSTVRSATFVIGRGVGFLICLRNAIPNTLNPIWRHRRRSVSFHFGCVQGLLWNRHRRISRSHLSSAPEWST